MIEVVEDSIYRACCEDEGNSKHILSERLALRSSRLRCLEADFLEYDMVKN